MNAICLFHSVAMMGNKDGFGEYPGLSPDISLYIPLLYVYKSRELDLPSLPT